MTPEEALTQIEELYQLAGHEFDALCLTDFGDQLAQGRWQLVVWQLHWQTLFARYIGSEPNEVDRRWLLRQLGQDRR